MLIIKILSPLQGANPPGEDLGFRMVSNDISWNLGWFSPGKPRNCPAVTFGQNLFQPEVPTTSLSGQDMPRLATVGPNMVQPL